MGTRAVSRKKTSTQFLDPVWPPPPLPPTDADALLSRAERRAGCDPASAVSLFDQASAAFQAVLGVSGIQGDADTAADAWSGLGEALQRKGDALLAADDRAPDAGPATRSAAVAAATASYEAAVAAYARVPGPVAGLLPAGAGLRLDAAVHAANTLCAAVEAAGVNGSGASCTHLNTAIALYRGALAGEEDAGVATNLADALAQRASLLATPDQRPAAAPSSSSIRAAFAEADAAYAAAVAASSSDAGDDLPGLLCNWAASTAAAAGGLGGDPALLATAAARFREAAAFGRGDPAPLTGLGDTLVEMAGAAADVAGSGLPGADPESAALLATALEDGYCAALALDRRFADAHAGAGDVRLAQSRATRAAGDEGGAMRLAAEAASAYGRALAVPSTSPRSLGGWGARAEVGWNAACALALSGQGGACLALLRDLVAREPALAGEVLGDPDLAGCPAVRAWVEGERPLG